MKTLVTHYRPHLDDVCAFWLLKRYLPEAKDADLAFTATGPRGGQEHDGDDVVCVGVGRGKFDEHKGDVNDCATTLVFKHVLSKVALDPREERALRKIVDWVYLEDTGRLSTIDHRDFTLPVLIELYPAGPDSDRKVTELGFAILDALLVVQRNAVHIEDDWAKRQEVDTRYGKAVAIESAARKVDTFAYAKGFKLVVIVDPDRTYHTVRADAASDIDLTPAWEKVRAKDPQADWYFHHSKKMLICGGDHAPNARHSSLTLADMIEALQ
ncbi:MAG TPA: hypothetical protein VL426_01720 [Candidatus Binatia bacterium]|nr:hypothetical protein [Candidatus Binatia bacterium]